MTKNPLPRIGFLGVMFVCLTATAALAQTTAFTYQGKLTDAGNPANGNYDLQFKLFDTVAVGAGAQQGATLTRTPIAASAGVFTVTLDFGANVFSGVDRFLEIGVRPAGNAGAYAVLAPRQPITSSPYAIQTLNTQQLGGLPPGRFVQFDASGNIGIGIAARAGIKLDLVGNALITPGGVGTGSGVMQFGTPNAETGMSNIVETGRADLRFDGTTLKLVAGPVGAPPSALNGIAIGTTGRVGIGTTTLTKAKLQVDGGAVDGILATSVFGVGVSGEGVFGGVRGFTDTTGSRGVYGISIDGTGVEGSSNGGNGFAVFSNGFLGVNRLGTGGSVTLCSNAANQVATCSSSLRYKTEMRPFSGGMNVIRRLRPLSYKWKADHTPDVGFGAEEVAAIDPLFVSYNDKGEVEGVKYDRLSAVFVNAFQAQQAQLERQQRQIARLQRQLRDLQPHADMCR